MNQSFTAPSRYAETVLVAGTAVTKGTASNGVKAVTATTDKPAGVVLEAKSAADIAAGGDATVAPVIFGPIPAALAGGAIEIDDDVQVNTSGAFVAKSGAGWVVGKALTKAAAGEYFELFVNIRKEPA